MFNLKIKSDFRNKAIFIKISDLRSKNKEGIRKAFYDIGKDLTKTTSNLILAPKHGKIYKIRRLKRIKMHRASAPGEAPANLSGTLRKSVGFDVNGSTKMEFGVRAPTSSIKTKKTTGAIYGVYLEDGTKKMAKRPFLITAIKQNQKNTKLRFDTWLKRELSK